MENRDSVNLLRECDAGVKMGVSAIDEVLPRTNSEKFKEMLIRYKNEHEDIGTQTSRLLGQWGEAGKEPNPIAKGMSWMKTNMKMAIEDDDKTIADLMTDGCNMGIKSLRRYLNEFKAAGEDTRQLTRRLIQTEENMASDLKTYL